MAKPPPSKKPQGSKPAPVKSGGGGGAGALVLACVVLALMAAFLLPTTILLLAGLMPTFVALVIDSTHDRKLTISVLLPNLASVLPFIIKLWQGGHGLEDSLYQVMQPFFWLVALGGAGAGWAIFHFVPKLIANLTTLKLQAELRRLQEIQQQLIEKWGKDVAGPEFDDVAGAGTTPHNEKA